MRLVTSLIAGIMFFGSIAANGNDFSRPNTKTGFVQAEPNSLSSDDFQKLKLGMKFDEKGNPVYLSNKIYVKLKAEAQKTAKKGNIVQATYGKKFGIPSLDKKLDAFGAKVNRAFRLSPNLPDKVRNRMRPASELPDLSRIYTISFRGPYDLRKVVAQFAADPNVEYAEPVPVNYVTAVPNDEKYPDCQHLPQIMAENAWDVHKGENGTTPTIIGICDTGVDWNHPDLNANVRQNMGEDADKDGTVLQFIDSSKVWGFDPGDVNGIDDDGNGYIDDFIGWHFMSDLETESQDNNPKDYQVHGTHVAGIAAGVTNNNTGIASISWNVKFLTAATAPPQSNYIYNGYDAVVYLAENGADVINCSWGGSGYSRANAESIEYVYGLGTIVIASAGNNNNTELFFPASFPKVVGIASVASNDKKASYSTYNKSVDISAPGGDYSVDGAILSTYPDSGYVRFQGTSMAGPLAAGVFGLLRSYKPDWNNDRVISQILGTADDIDTLNPKYLDKLGTGRINAYRALSDENPKIKNKISIDLIQTVVNDSNANNNGALEPGEEINVGFTFRNYSPFITANGLKFRIQSLDNDIDVINAEYTGSLANDGFTQLPPVFRVKINSKAFSKFVPMKIEVISDNVEIVNGSEFDFDIPINAGGILIWEGHKGSGGYSGSFLRDFLSIRGFKVLYTNNFPASLSGFDAVFLSFGSYGSKSGSSISTTGFDAWMADVVADFLKRGGKLYFEGSEALGWDQKDNKELLALMGIDSSDDGTDYKSLDTLLGVNGSIMEDLEFFGTSMTFRSVDRIYTKSAKAAFTEPGYGTPAIQFTGQNNQKVFTSIYPVAELYDQGNPNCRYEIVKRVLDFFGFDFEYTVPRFTQSQDYGNSPLTVSFTDQSFTSIPVKTFDWDFDNDGVFDLQGSNPKWDYQKNGSYRPVLSVFNGRHRHKTSGSVEVFDGETALSFASNYYHAVSKADELNELGKAFTIEAWINAKGAGARNVGTIISKKTFILSMYTDNRLRAYFENANGKRFEVASWDYTLVPNNWQHVAVTYDGKKSLKLFINGKEQELDTLQGEGPDTLKDNSNTALYIGNTENLSNGFNGRIDELRIWKTQKSQPEIEASMNKSLTGYEQNLLTYWTFEESKGDTTTTYGKNKLGAKVNSRWGQGWHPGIVKAEPLSQNICAENSVAFLFDVNASSDSVNYKWFLNDSPLNIQSKRYENNMGELKISNLSDEDIGDYHATADIFKGGVIEQSITSAKATLKVLPKAYIKSQSDPTVSFMQTGKLELFVEAIGAEPVYYQWYKDEFPVSGGLMPSLTIEDVTTEDMGVYYCQVSSACGTLNSNPVTVDIFPNEVPELLSGGDLLVKPNPVSGYSEIIFENGKPSQVTCNVFNMIGSSTVKLFEGWKEKCIVSITFNPGEHKLAPGMYIIIVDINGKKLAKPVIVRE